MKVIVYAEHTLMGGQTVSQRDLEVRGEDSADFVVFEGNAETLRDHVRRLEARRGNEYAQMAAGSIRETLEWEGSAEEE